MLEREAESAAGGAEPSPTEEPVTKGEGEGVSPGVGGVLQELGPRESRILGTLG